MSLAVHLLYLGWSKSQLFLWQHALVKPSPYGWGAEAILLLFGYLLGMGGAPPAWNGCVCVHMCLLSDRNFDLFFLIESRKCEICERPFQISTSTKSIMSESGFHESDFDLLFWANERPIAICRKVTSYTWTEWRLNLFYFKLQPSVNVEVMPKL